MFDWDTQKDFLNVDAVVERCTSDMLFQPDYEQNLAIVDQLNDKPKLIETYLAAIRRRMSNPPEEIVLSLCVTLVETILKNVPGALDIWGKREFQEAVVQICVTTKHLRAREPLLELIQTLGITYQDNSNWKFGLAYKELLNRHRISFPPTSKQPFSAPSARPSGNASSQKGETQDLHKSARRAPQEDVYDPTSFEEDNGPYEHVHSKPHQHQSKTKGRQASIEDQLESVSGSLSLLNDIIDNLLPTDKILENELIQSILPTVTSLQENILRILQGDLSSFDETLTVRLFSANDAISEALQKYEKAKKGILPPKRSSPSPALVKAPSPVPRAPPKPSLPVEEDPFDDFSALAERKRPDTRILDLLTLQQAPVVASGGVPAELSRLYSTSPQQPMGPVVQPQVNPFIYPGQQPSPMAPPNPFGAPLLPSSPSSPPAASTNPFAPAAPGTPSILQPTQTSPYGGPPSFI